MCKTPWIVGGILIALVTAFVFVAPALSAPTDGTDTCKISISQAQERVAELDGKTLTLASPTDLAKIEGLLRMATQGQAGLEEGVDTVLLVQIKERVFIGEFKDKCLLLTYPIPAELMTLILGVIAGDK